ncbi:MAG: JAB domain-containing protein [Thermosipho sp. (in: Bacteria)]|nr:JAB domain-containing protein [Thermosipho sp. (in: thermotogales)]
MTNIQLLKLKVVKEKGARYDVPKKVTCPDDIKKIAIEVLELDEQAEEVLALVTLDTKLKVTGVFEVSRGSINSSIVHPREIFKRAMLVNASSIAILHNHPSGDPKPSKEDNKITRRLQEAGNLLGIELIDHVIIGDDSYFSYKEHGII